MSAMAFLLVVLLLLLRGRTCCRQKPHRRRITQSTALRGQPTRSLELEVDAGVVEASGSVEVTVEEDAANGEEMVDLIARRTSSST